MSLAPFLSASSSPLETKRMNKVTFSPVLLLLPRGKWKAVRLSLRTGASTKMNVFEVGEFSQPLYEQFGP